MRTADGMYAYCIDNDFGSGFNKTWARKHFGVIERNLQENEEVLMTFIGIHNYRSMSKHDGNHAYALTNKRIIMGKKKVMGEESKTVLLHLLNDVGSSTGFAMGTITFDTMKEKFSVWVGKEQIANILGKLQGYLMPTEELKEPVVTTAFGASGVSGVSGADEIRKFKELLDEGIITEDDFNRKKKELLGF